MASGVRPALGRCGSRGEPSPGADAGGGERMLRTGHSLSRNALESTAARPTAPAHAALRGTKQSTERERRRYSAGYPRGRYLAGNHEVLEGYSKGYARGTQRGTQRGTRGVLKGVLEGHSLPGRPRARQWRHGRRDSTGRLDDNLHALRSTTFSVAAEDATRAGCGALQSVAARYSTM